MRRQMTDDRRQKTGSCNKLELNPGEKTMISSLINSIYYFIDFVYILRSKDKYRLVALQHRRVLFDKYYPTVKGSRIAFQKLFKDKAWSEEVKAEWSHFYVPDKHWLGKKQSRLET
jgi:hypothetical protein